MSHKELARYEENNSFSDWKSWLKGELNERGLNLLDFYDPTSCTLSYAVVDKKTRSSNYAKMLNLGDIARVKVNLNYQEGDEGSPVQLGVDYEEARRYNIEKRAAAVAMVICHSEFVSNIFLKSPIENTEFIADLKKKYQEIYTNYLNRQI